MKYFQQSSFHGDCDARLNPVYFFEWGRILWSRGQYHGLFWHQIAAQGPCVKPFLDHIYLSFPESIKITRRKYKLANESISNRVFPPPSAPTRLNHFFNAHAKIGGSQNYPVTLFSFHCPCKEIRISILLKNSRGYYAASLFDE